MCQRGIVNQVVQRAELPHVAESLADRLATGPTQAHAVHKSLLRTWAAYGVFAADDPESLIQFLKRDGNLMVERNAAQITIRANPSPSP